MRLAQRLTAPSWLARCAGMHCARATRGPALRSWRAFNSCGTCSGRLESGTALMRGSQRSHYTGGKVAPMVKCHACSELAHSFVQPNTCAVRQLGHATPQ